MEKVTCAFTGHRPAKLPWRYNETAKECIRLKKILAVRINGLVKVGTTDFMSGMDLGTDVFCVEIVLALRERNPDLKLHGILPCKGQEAKWPPSSQARYHAILERADSTYYVSNDYTNTCLLERNHYLVDHASVLLAVYDGTRRSGTGATVNYARKLGREIIIVDPLTFAITHENATV